MRAKFLHFVAFSTIPLCMATGQDLVVENHQDSGPGSLREALTLATNGDVIGFAPSLSNATITLANELVVTKPITIDGSGLASPIRISGNDACRVFHIQQSGVVLDSLIITNGKAANATVSTAAETGGGIQNAGGLTLLNCTVRDSKAGNGGFSNPNGGRGGGIYNTGSQLTIENSTISGNQSGNGGSNGTGGSGGGIDSNAGSSLTIINSTIYGNSTGTGDGTGEGGKGGGIANQAPLTLISTTITRNATGIGGVAAGEGGGLYAFANSGSIAIENTIISQNSVGPQGSADAITSDIFFHPVVNNDTATTTTGVNFIGINSGGNAAFPDPGSPGDPNSNGDLVGTFALPRDAQLAPPGNTGGIHMTILPLTGSPVIDPIDGEASSTLIALDFDQRGFPRVVNGVIDIGAVEFDAENQAARDAAAAAALAAKKAAVLRASLRKKIRGLTTRFKVATRKGQSAKADGLKKKIKKLKQRLGRI